LERRFCLQSLRRSDAVKAKRFAGIVTLAMFGALAWPNGPATTISHAADKAAGPVVSKPVGVILDTAQKQMLAGDYSGAKATVMGAQALTTKTPADDYEINNFLGNIAIKLNDHVAAEIAYEAMAESPAIPDSEKAETFRIATLLAAEQRHFDLALKYGKEFLDLKGPAEDSVLAALAQTYFYKDDYANAEIYGKKAIAATPASHYPNEGALDAVFASQIKLRQDADAISTLETLVTYYDDPSNWGQLIDIALGTKGIKDTEALSLYRLKLATNSATHAEDYDFLATLALTNGYPVEAQSALERGISSGKLSVDSKLTAQLANARLRAEKDRALLPALEASAIKASSGELDVKLAQDYFGYGRYADAIDAARRGLAKGGAKVDPNEANFLIGMAFAMQGKNADAINAFNTMSGGSNATRAAQHLWITFASRKYADTHAK
jgi:hypothetical protein